MLLSGRQNLWAATRWRCSKLHDLRHIWLSSYNDDRTRCHLQAWEFDVPLRVVALRSSVPGAWPADFRAVAGKHARFSLEQRGQLADIYSELTDRRQE